MKSGIIILFLFFIVSIVYAQTPGLIVKPATGAGASVLDPNGDGYASQTNQGYIVNDFDNSETEIDFTDLVRPDPIGDPLTGPSGLYNDIVGTNSDGEHAIFTYTDGVNYIIRFRLDGYAKNSKAYSLLLDTDGKFGFTGANADPNAVPGNPGFEIEIALFTNFNVVVADLDGNANGDGNIVSGDGTNGITRSYDEYCQKSIAKSFNSNDPDYFYTFFIPFSDLLLAVPTLTTSTPLRYAAVTSMNPHASIGNNATSDVSGDTNGGSGIDNIFEELVETQTPTVPGEEVLDRSTCPSINSPISSGATSISGTSTEASGTSIEVFVDDISIGTTTTSGTSWTLNSIGPLYGGQVVYATATASGKGESHYSCNTTFVGSDCTDPPTFVQLINGNKGIEVNVIGPIGTVVTLFGPNSDNEWIDLDSKGSATDNKGVPYDNNPYTTTAVDETGIQIKAGTGQALSDGVYYLTAQGPTQCESQKTYFCTGTGILTTQTPSIDVTDPNSSTITGSLGLAGATVFLFADGVLIGQKTLVSTGTWSINVDPTNICNISLTAKQIENGYCISVASTAVIVGQGTTSAPTINSSQCSSSISSISGYSSEDNGTTIEAFVNGVSVGTTTVSNGTWNISASASTNDVLTATAYNSANCKTVSVLSSSVTINGTTALSGTFSINSPVTEGDTSVPITVSGTSGTYTLNLYIDGDLIGSNSFSANGTVSITPTYSLDLYTGGNLTVSLTQGAQCESGQTSTLATVQCNIPDFIGRDLSSAITNKCVSTSGTLSLTNSESLTIYTPVDASGTQKGYSTLGNGSTITMDTYPFGTAGTTTFYVKAEQLVASGSCDSISLTSVTFNAYSNPIIGVQPIDQNLCSGDGTSVYTAWTGQGPFNIQWQYNNGGGFMNLSDGGIYSQTTIASTSSTNATLLLSDVTGLDGFMYRAIITDLGIPTECQESTSDAATFTVDLVFISSQTITNATSGNNGAVDITVSGGDGNYTYDWHHIDGTGDFDDPQDLTNISGGTYTVTVKDGNNCTYEETFTVGGVGSINLATISQSNISCFGSNDGTFEVKATTGTRPYTFSIDNFTTSQPDSVFSNLGPGTYTIKAKDNNLAESNSVSITITEPIEMVVYATISNPSVILGDGSIYTTVIGGTTPLTYELYKVGTPDVLITTISNTSSRTTNFQSLSNGEYYINLTDANGCIASNSGIILTNPSTTINSCSYVAAHSFNGAQATESGFDGTYNLFNTAWTESTPNDHIQIYQQTLALGHIPTDTKNDLPVSNSISRQLDLLGASNIIVSYTYQCDNSVSQDAYSITFAINGTTIDTYTINSNNQYSTVATRTISSGVTFKTTSADPMNTFTYTISGSARSNFRVDDFSVTFDKPITTGIITTPSTCNNGTIDLSITGGYSPYTYDWSIDGFGAYDDSQDQSGLAAGTYSVMVKGSKGCTTATATDAIVGSAPLTASISGTDPTCLGGGSNGQIAVTLTAVGSGGPYTYKLIKGVSDTIATSVTAASTKTFAGLANGTYSVKIWQATGGCTTQTADQTINLPNFSSLISSTGVTSFCTGSTTTVAVTMTGGTSPFSVVLSNGQLIANYISGNDITLTPSPASSTTITVTSVTDANSCVSSSNTGSVALTVSSGATTPTSLSSDRNNFCADDAGTISLSATGGAGTTLRWFTGSCGGTDIGTGNPLAIASPTVTTTYYARYEATCGTSTCASVIVTVYDNPLVSVTSYTDANCAADQDGSIDITPSGGSGTYTYLWNTTATSQDITNLGSGTYSVTVTDGNTCTAITSQLISYTDTEAPIVTCLSDIVQSANGGGCTRQINLSAPSITDNCVGAITNYTWAFTGATTGSGDQTDYTGNHTFNSGITTVTLTATDGTNSGNCSYTITINGDVNVTGLAASVSDICQGVGTTATITGSLADDSYTINYSLSGANSASSQTATMVVSGTGGGTFTIPSSSLLTSGSTTLNIESIESATSSCTATVALSPSFIVSAGATITLGSNPTFCQGTTAGSISYSALTGSPDQYSIDFVDASFTDVTNVAITASPLAFTIPSAIAGSSYGATLSVRNSSTGCSSTGYGIAVHINEVSGGTISASSTNCSGGDPDPFTESVASTGTSGGTLTYQWQSKTTGSYSDIPGETATTYDPPSSLGETTTYSRITTNTLNGVACTAVSNELVVTIANFNLIVTPNGLSNCPDISNLTTPAFNPDNADYNAGATIVTFRVSADLDYTSDWSFDFSLTGTVTVTSANSTVTALSTVGDVTTPTKTGTNSAGNIVAGSNTYVDLTFQIQNTPGSSQSISFSISNTDNGSGCSETVVTADNSASYTIDSMPVVGSFN